MLSDPVRYSLNDVGLTQPGSKPGQQRIQSIERKLTALTRQMYSVLLDTLISLCHSPKDVADSPNDP